MLQEKPTGGSSGRDEDDPSGGASEASVTQPPQAAEGNPTQAPSSESPDVTCRICLDVVRNACSPDTCSHKFCFECLAQWSARRSVCPLCNLRFHCILHSESPPGVLERYYPAIRRRIRGPRVSLETIPERLRRPYIYRLSPPTAERVVPQTDNVVAPAPLTRSQQEAAQPAAGLEHLAQGPDESSSLKHYRYCHGETLSAADFSGREASTSSRASPSEASTSSRASPSEAASDMTHGSVEAKPLPAPRLFSSALSDSSEDGECSPELTEPMFSPCDSTSSEESEAARKNVVLLPLRTNSSTDNPLHSSKDMSRSSQALDSPPLECEPSGSSDRAIASSDPQQTSEEAPILTEVPGPQDQTSEEGPSEESKPTARGKRNRSIADTFP